MVELHIFDFDGTIFFSPAVDPDALAAALAAAGDLSACDAAVAAKKLHGKLRSPVFSGGLGWYQSLSTMSPPAVPDRPDEATWFVQPILAHIRAIVEVRNALLKKRGPTTGKESSPPEAADLPLIYVLTGRDGKYRDRIWTLMQQVGLDKEIEDILLKPNEVAGTVKHKLNHFFSLAQFHQPARIFYYEDRAEQGAKLLEGMRVLEKMLYPDVNDKPNDAVSGCSVDLKTDRVGVVTFDVAGGDQAASPGCDVRGAVPPPSSVLHVPQPTVVSCADRKGPTPKETDGNNANFKTLAASLLASPYSLLRDACYPVDQHVLFYSHSPTNTSLGASTAAAAAALRQAERQAQHWVEGTVHFYNTKGDCKSRDQSEGGRPITRETGSSACSSTSGSVSHPKRTRAYNKRALRSSINFTIPPPFVFIMVLLPSALSGRSSHMLSGEQLLALLRTLEEEQRRAGKAAVA
ncbi:hypothetical protein JKF63_04882 [Porcisia hertigi]|uniref:Swiss Army Knife RNA repair protein HAD domain-containing protein n=1 Tax=Porcisia hertigi TaxID=2761500 RepID=A0A836IUY3_9TRYP|nr:hypothetical protein JKF63_04882 [Porcisia hertigi]